MRPPLAARLRDETRGAHDAIEAAVDFESRVATGETYRHWLERLYGFHRSWEPRVAEALADPAFFAPRRKLHLLAADLAGLGQDRPEALPAPDWPRFGSIAEALGSLYVIEGSTLGGQVIARAVRGSLGIEPAYHASYGREAGRMWRDFQARLGELPEGAHDACVAGAERTFVAMREWVAVPAAAAAR